MKKSCFLIVLLLSTLPLISQEQSNYPYMDRNAEPAGAWKNNKAHTPSVIARISFIAPMFMLEFAPIQDFVFSTGIRIWPSFWEKNDQGQTIYNPTFNPRMTLEPRWFFNQSYRRSKGKRTDFYSGWYLGLPFMMTFPELDFSMGTVMGFQCSFGKHWYWNVSLGPGVAYQESTFSMVATGTAAFGVILN